MLKRGSDAFAIINKPCGKTGKRNIFVGAARVRIKNFYDGKYTVVVVSGSGISAGAIRHFTREDLYATPAERQYFKELIGWFLEGIPRTMERPSIEE
jgi:hypothetical protein